MSDLKVSSGGTEAAFGARSQAIHYDLLLYGADRESSIRPFVAAGGGMKLYQGTGKEVESQPLGQFAILSRTSQVQGLISVGGGFKYRVGDRTFLNLEIRDYITKAPKDVIAPYVGSKMSGWVHSLVPMVGLSFGF
jgi:outer membrane protein W